MSMDSAATLNIMASALDVIKAVQTTAAAIGTTDASLVFDPTDALGVALQAVVAAVPETGTVAHFASTLFTAEAEINEQKEAGGPYAPLWPTPLLTTSDRRIHIDRETLADCDAAVATWLPLCVPSMFGDVRTQTTVLDETQRRSVEFAAPDMTVHPDVLETIRQRWRTAGLRPADVRVVPKKLLIYREGDHFAEHRDTPSGTLVGTAVLCLAARDGRDNEQKLHIGAHSYHMHAGDLALFYPDVPHAVTPPLPPDALRVVLTLELHADVSNVTEADGVPDEAAAPFLRKLGERGGRCAILCAHKYPLSAALRGGDLGLCEALNAMPGVCVRGPLPCVVRIATSRYPEGDMEREAHVRLLDGDIMLARTDPIYAPFAIAYSAEAGDPYAHALTGVTRDVPSPPKLNSWDWDESFEDTDSLCARTAYAHQMLTRMDRLRLRFDEQESAAWTGNEALPHETTSVYLDALLFVELKTARKRTREQAEEENK